MDTVVVGSKERFAIEYRPAEPHPYISTMIWCNGKWCGDIEDAVMPGRLCQKLLAMCDVPRRFQDFTYDTIDDAPTKGRLLEDVSRFSLGEAFDGTNLAYFRLLDPGLVCFSWRQDGRPWQKTPQASYACCFEMVPQKDFQETVIAFVVNLLETGRLSNCGGPLDAMLWFLELK